MMSSATRRSGFVQRRRKPGRSLLTLRLHPIAPGLGCIRVGHHSDNSTLTHELLPAMTPKPGPVRRRWDMAYSAFANSSLGPLTSVPYVTRNLH
jgi:hypothetical protein